MSVIIPARNEAVLVAKVVAAVVIQRSRAAQLEVLVIDDGSEDDTSELAKASGARVISMRPPGERGNAAAARNRGAAESRGDPLIFLDADCIVQPGWLEALLAAHERGAAVVGGSLAMPAGLSFSARCDYYCGWYVIHPRARSGWVHHHPPPNLSVRRNIFAATSGFATEPPFDFSNEERFWQGEALRAGHRIYFEPLAIAEHVNHSGVRNLLRRNYRWGYTAVEAKMKSGAARMAWLYRQPLLVIAASPLLALAHTAFIVACWVRVRTFEPVLMLPLILVSRATYVAGLVVGAWRWWCIRHQATSSPRPGPRWQ